MKPRVFLPKYRLNPKINVYSGAPVNKGFYERNLQKAKTIYMNKCCKTPKKFFRRREDRAFNQLINNYYEDYNKFKKKHKYIQKYLNPIKKQETNFDYNQYELKKKNLSALFFAYDLRDNEETNFDITDRLINSMYNGKDDTLIKTTQIRNDYEMRLNGKKNNEPKYNNFINDNEDKKNNKFNRTKNVKFEEEYSSGDQSSHIKNNNNDSKIQINKNMTYLKKPNEEKEDDDKKNIFFIEGGDIVNDDNYLEFSNNIYLDKKSPLFKDIIDSKFKDNYDLPEYKIPQSVYDEENYSKKKNLIPLNKYKGGELKRFKDMIESNEYPGYEQLISPYYPTKYIPPPCFPKLPEDEEENENEEYGYEDFGFNEEDNKEIKEEDDDTLILLSNQITNKEFPMFEHLIRNDFKGNYAPPTYKIPPNIEKNIQKEKEKKEKDKEIYEKNKNMNVGNDINRYEDNKLKMIDNILKNDEYPLFEQLINPYYPTNYIPPEIFPKPDELIEKNNEELDDNYDDFELIKDKKMEGNKDDNNLALINNEILNKEYPMFEHLIRNDFKGNYAPPIYKIPDYLDEEKTDYAANNKKNFEQMKGSYVNYNEHQPNEYPTVQQMVNSNYKTPNEEKNQNENERDFEDNEYNDFE